MNPIEEFKRYFDDHVIKHEGVSVLDGAPGRGSGRYPLGSGANPNQHIDQTFLSRVKEMRSKGMSDPEIAKAMGIYGESKYGKDPQPSSGRLRTQIALAVAQDRLAKIDKAVELSQKGYNPTQIARMMGYNNESSVRNLLKDDKKNRTEKSMVTANLLKDIVDNYTTKDQPGMIDVGAKVETQLGCSKERLNEALYILELQGYKIFKGGLKQHPGKNDKQTNMKVLCSPNAQHKDIYDYRNVHSVLEYDKMISQDPETGKDVVIPSFKYPESLDSNRIFVRYKEDGGLQRDGTVEIRRGVPDLSLGDSHYSQVRILVDGTHYIKGVAVYGDDKDFPPGKDIIFNSNKPAGTPLKTFDGKKQVLKNIVDDPDNPFGSYIKAGDGEHGERGGQSYYIDPVDGKKKLSLINKRSDEGDWGEWGKDIPTQFLAKQPKELIKKQIGISIEDKRNELNDILALNNPTVKKKLLQEYANKCDGAAVDLKAAALPREKYQVILPLTTIKDDECFAPNYHDGEKVALIRYPHQGIHEIPILTVNNRNKEGRNKISANAKDAIGITQKTAEILSGADFDGDTVMVIPIGKDIKISSKPPLRQMEGFDNKDKYQYHDVKIDSNGEKHYYRYGVEFKPMSHHNTQIQMGIVSNLITDMTLLGASDDHIARATKHSMVVIDAEKHGLDWQASYKDNGIEELKKLYQKKADGKYGGAATLISRAKGEERVDKRQGSPRVNLPDKEWYDPSRPEGALIYKTADDSKLYYPKVNKKTGETTWHKHTTETTRMANTDDAKTLISQADTQVERLYADYANELKSLANTARVEMSRAGRIKLSPSAAKTYAPEVERLQSALKQADLNKPRERQALREANAITEEKRKLWKQAGKSSKEIEEDLSKEHQRALTAARAKYGSKRVSIVVSDKEWEAIQAGAISENRLMDILNNSDMDVIRKMATPKGNLRELPPYKQQLIRIRASRGYTNDEIAKSLGISASTVSKYL